ncbi:PREDICTED: uncharacterized protein LOC106323970 [Brassica oleracea var. oleracea]|uniref:uncharacterized protein LOC106323970 n=1 Tax=Brassica oleracea var. oleracea TaxID=109376 RepID=UPI0006A6B662|nr:PREDICTED: uncharacterized protein LOC106323970 [Brassica oleracea var. oleracea]
MEHIESFEKVCSFTRVNGVPPDYIRCMLFPFSLDGKAARWLNSLPTGSLTSWEQVRSAFLSHFYSKARATALRNKITSFRQLTDEPFCDAWESFNYCRRECPHHGFDDDYLMDIFYDGVDWKYQANKKEERDFSMKGNSSDTQKIDELTAKIQNQNQQQLQSNQQVVPATGNSQSDELRGLSMMMQQLLQGQQVQAKPLNQVTTEMDTRMDNMFTEQNNKYDTLAIHIRKIDVQLAQTAESVKRQQETLPGKTDKNPRTEHCNAIEQSFAETVLGVEENTEQSASSAVTAPDESAENPPSRVYVPKGPYPIPPRHLMDPISEEQLVGFNKMVRRLPKELALEDALQIRPLLKFFKNCRETQEEVKVLYTKALSTLALKVLPKVDDPGKFVFPCSIAGTTFKDVLCDSGSYVNLVSKAIVDDLDIADVERSQLTLTFANSSRAVPYGTIRSLHVQVGECVVPAEFQVVEMNKDHEMPLIFGRTFMATVGATIDMPNKRVCFSNINKKVFYKAVPTRSSSSHASCMSVFNVEKLKVVPEKEHGDKGESRLFSDEHPSTDPTKFRGNSRVKQKVQKKRVKGDPMMTLIPRLCDEKSIEYEVKCKGTSKPFSKVRVMLTYELKEKGEAAVKGLLRRVLKLNMSDCGACFGTSPHDQPD